MTKSVNAGRFVEDQANQKDHPGTMTQNGESKTGAQTPDGVAGVASESTQTPDSSTQPESAPPHSPAGPAPEIEALQRDLAAANAKRDEYLDGWQRSQAEFSNYRRRIEREREQMQQILTGSIVKRYLEVVDDLERALKKRPTEGDGAAWADGIDLVYRKLLYALETEGVKLMQAKGQFFDPTRHEAIDQEDSNDFESGQVIDVVQNGYVIGDRVLRPALVRIAK